MMDFARVVSAFSLRKNVRYLFVPRGDAVPAVTGLRGLSMIWVLTQHVQQGLRPLGGTLPGAMFLAHPLLSVGWAGNLALEIFFVISGYLIGGMLMRERDANGAIDFGSFYARRALRILPVYVFAMAVNLSLPMVEHKEAVWSNLLFVNNYLPFRKQFMAHTWSLAIEEQLYLVAPMLVLLLHRARPGRRTRWIGASVAAACVVAVLVSLGARLELSVRFWSNVEFWRYMDVFYTKPYTRFGSIALGFLIAKIEADGRWTAALERRSALTTVLSLVSLGAIAFTIFVFPECREPSGARRLAGAFQLALDGYLFAAGVAFLLLLTRTQHVIGRFLVKVLGNRVLHPLAEISYGMYLLHPVCITPLYGWLGFDLAHPWRSYFTLLASAFVVSASAAMVVFVLIERPMMRLRPPPPALTKAA